MFPDPETKYKVNTWAISKPLGKAFPEAQLQHYPLYGLVAHLFLTILGVTLFIFLLR